ncbi:MAG: glycoside hydrolase family 127 protein [Anaerolineaceae bacterium]
MFSIPFQRVSIQDAFWSPRLLLNNTVSLQHQWNQLELSGCIQNFRLIADKIPGFRMGWFFSDSDAYKWLDAASRSIATLPNPKISGYMDVLIDLINRTQTNDGYIFTYNQFHFPDSRWENLQIEHELYCHGHLIEAGISHFQATGQIILLTTAIKAADLICTTFLNSGLDKTPGHEEIEIALIHLYDLTRDCRYVEMAEQFIEKRGRQPLPIFAWKMIRENERVKKRSQILEKSKSAFISQNPDFKVVHELPERNQTKVQKWAKERFMWSALNGSYFQQHTPIRNQLKPVGHAVRYSYLNTAITMISNRFGDFSLWPALQQSWNHMIEKRMFVTGGTGSLPISEAFGRDYELDPENAYAETCAALGSMFWNWEMTQLFKDAAYADLFERNLYNASLVGNSLSGTRFLYNNPLENRNGYERQSWFEIPCCPSNLSRTWASLGNYIFTHELESISIHQYIGSQVEIPLEPKVNIKIESDLPWQGKVKVHINPKSKSHFFELNMRIPSWCGSLKSRLNGHLYPLIVPAPQNYAPTASGYDPRHAQYITLRRDWIPGDVLELDFEMPIEINCPHKKVTSCAGRYAISRGPLVYCLEAQDNPGVDIFNCVVDSNSLHPEYDPELLGGVVKILGTTIGGQPLTFIPYAWWANREKCPMTVYVNI